MAEDAKIEVGGPKIIINDQFDQLMRGPQKKLLSPSTLENMPTPVVLRGINHTTKILLTSILRADLTLSTDPKGLESSIGMLTDLLDPEPDIERKFELDRVGSVLGETRDKTTLYVVFRKGNGETIEFSFLGSDTRLSSAGLGRSAEVAAARLAGRRVSARAIGDYDYGLRITFSGYEPGVTTGLELRCSEGGEVEIFGFEEIYEERRVNTAHSKGQNFSKFIGDELQKSVGKEGKSTLSRVIVNTFDDLVRSARKLAKK